MTAIITHVSMIRLLDDHGQPRSEWDPDRVNVYTDVTVAEFADALIEKIRSEEGSQVGEVWRTRSIGGGPVLKVDIHVKHKTRDGRLMSEFRHVVGIPASDGWLRDQYTPLVVIQDTQTSDPIAGPDERKAVTV